ncbi:hypothetical protein AG1IA_00570 [Rhizoctonia solani AG-1 IA]|uniref:Uncharacterized protein n=1 Tax=Thanatephorus cucumeris (strain AG1-IA) TaxID=983506 RepID=L8X8K9_THACA|nr:hypothetical protein AG1IA_00570 [Rhizoctonia solani AG-1 IA]
MGKPFHPRDSFSILLSRIRARKGKIPDQTKNGSTGTPTGIIDEYK